MFATTLLATASRDPYASKGRARVKKALRSVSEQHALIEKWAGLPRHVVGRLYRANRIEKWFRDDAEGYGQIALVRAARIWREDGGTSFPSYAIRAIRRRILSYYRRWLDREAASNSLNDFTSEEDQEKHDGFIDHRPVFPTREIREREQTECLAVLDRYRDVLSPLQIDVLTFRFVNRQTYRDVGIQLGISAGHVAQVVRTATHRIRRSFPEDQ